MAFRAEIAWRIDRLMAICPLNADLAILSFFDLYGLWRRLIRGHVRYSTLFRLSSSSSLLT